MSERDIGRMEGEVASMQRDVENIRADIAAVKRDVQAIKEQLATVAGAWRVAVWIAGVLGMVLGVLARSWFGKGAS